MIADFIESVPSQYRMGIKNRKIDLSFEYILVNIRIHRILAEGGRGLWNIFIEIWKERLENYQKIIPLVL